MRHISIPIYLLDDAMLASLIEKAQDVMINLAGEDDTPELPLIITACRAELSARNTRVYAGDPK